MLFVDDGQAERAEVHRPLHERVRADNQVDVAGREPRKQIAPLQPGRRAGDELDAEARFLQELPQAEEVLLGENFSRRHERHLQAVLHRDERREQRHNRLACADITLQQAVHRRRALHVLDDLLQRAPLPFGQLERQNAARRLANAIVDLDRAWFRLANGGAFSHHQPQLKQEELFEDEPDLCGCSKCIQRSAGVSDGGKCASVSAARRSGRPTRRRTSSGNGSGKLIRHARENIEDQSPLHLRRHGAGFFVHGNDAAGVNRLRVFGLGGIAVSRDHLVIGIDNLEAGPRFHSAKQHNADITSQDVLEKRLIHPDRDDRSCRISDERLENLEPWTARCAQRGCFESVQQSPPAVLLSATKSAAGARDLRSEGENDRADPRQSRGRPVEDRRPASARRLSDIGAAFGDSRRTRNWF